MQFLEGETDSGVQDALEDAEKALRSIVEAEQIRHSEEDIENTKQRFVNCVKSDFMGIVGSESRFDESTRPNLREKESAEELKLHEKGVTYHSLARVAAECNHDVAVYNTIIASVRDRIKGATGSAEETDDALFRWFTRYRVPSLDGTELQRYHELLNRETSEARLFWERAQANLTELRDSGKLCAQRSRMWDIENGQGMRARFMD